MNKKKHISLFSGIGGFDLAAEWMGWENVAHCEWNPFGQRVLKHYWPNAISYHDITQTDFTVHRGQIDILTGGFPCQPYSQAGKRLGKEDERHLWPEMLRAIREIAPRWVVGENVGGLVNWNGGMVFDEVQAELEAEGYEVQPFLLPAAGVNAPHRRDRIWFIAYAHGNADRHFGEPDREKNSIQGVHRQKVYTRQSSGTVARPIADPESNGNNKRGFPHTGTDSAGQVRPERPDQLHALCDGHAPNTDYARLQGGGGSRKRWPLRAGTIPTASTMPSLHRLGRMADSTPALRWR